MFKHTTKDSILSGFLIGLALFVVESLVSDSSFGGLIMGLSFFVFFAMGKLFLPGS